VSNSGEKYVSTYDTVTTVDQTETVDGTGVSYVMTTETSVFSTESKVSIVV
jgi:hypothetical protein